MSNLGMGVMIELLKGNEESVNAYTTSLGQKINDIALLDNELLLKLQNGKILRFRDEGQSCCEHRYMSSDGDDLSYFIGADLLGADIKEAPNVEDEYAEVHEVAFLEVLTSRGSFQLSNHNEHNGYYGGFAIRASLAKAWPEEA